MRAYVLARKGILASDPSVAKMSKAQWLLEFSAIHDKERDEREFQVKLLRNTLVSVLGLNIATSIDADADPEAFVPLIFLAGNHHLMKGYFDKIKEKGETLGPATIADDDFEAMAQRMMEGMEPMDDDPMAGVNLKELLSKKDAQILKIQQVDGTIPPPDISDNIPRRKPPAIVSDGE